MEKLGFSHGNSIQIHGIKKRGRDPKILLLYKFFAARGVKCSPKGVYFASVHLGHIIISKAEGALVPMAVCHHDFVRCCDFSPLDKYLVTYSRQPSIGQITMKIFVVETGALLKEFAGCDRDFLGIGVHRISDTSLPLIRWSADEKHFALIHKDILSIYADEALAAPLPSIKNVIDFCWSPTDPFIALLCYDACAGDVKLSIVKVPEGKDVVTKKLKCVSHFKIYWHQQGKYVACTFKSLGENKSMDTGILVLEIGGRNALYIPANMGRGCSVLAFSFEPLGSRFAVIYGRKKDKFIRIKDLDEIENNSLHSPLFDMQANALYWSPTGGVIVFSGCGDFMLYDVNKMKILVKEEYTPLAIEWSPLGRFVATYDMKKKVAVWHSSGKFMYCIDDYDIGRPNLPQLFWCPPSCAVSFRVEYETDALDVISKSYEIFMAYKKKVSEHHKAEEMKEELQPVSVDDESEEKAGLFEIDFYPDDDQNGPLIEGVASRLFSLLDMLKFLSWRVLKWGIS